MKYKNGGWDREALNIYLEDVVRDFSPEQIEYMAWWLSIDAEDKQRKKDEEEHHI